MMRMNMILRVLLIMIAIISFDLNAASEIFNCYQAGNSSIVYDTYKKIFDSSSEIKESKTNKVTLVVNEKDALIKGDSGDAIKLTRFNNSFIEDTGSNLILWKLLKNSVSKKETYLFQMKAYDSLGPASFTTLYKCD